MDPLALRLPRPGELCWQIVSPHWTSVDIYGSANAFLRTFAQVPEPAGHLLAVRWCESEVCNGGFHQFFTNPTGVLAPEATRGFRAINLPAIAEIVEKAMALFGTPYPRERQERRQFLSKFLDRTKTDDPFAALDEAFYDSIGDDVLYDAVTEKDKGIVYVSLLDEGVEVFRPVPALMLPDSNSLLRGEDIFHRGDEKWEFPPGTTVRVEERVLSGRSVVVA